MVRFAYKRPAPSNSKEGINLYFPFYAEEWVSYDPNDTSECKNLTWKDVWQKDEVRDKLHRKNSYYYSLELEKGESLPDSPSLAIILFGSIIFCLFVPQIIDLLITLYCPGSLPPETPPTPPPGRKCRKQLKLYHYAVPNNKTRKRRSSIKGSVTDEYVYDPENILNYVSATRIRTLEHLSEDDADDEAEQEDDRGQWSKHQSDKI